MRRFVAQSFATELRIVPDATHLWNRQQPEAFNLAVADFVDKAEAAKV